jgi:hypothetical protein
LLDGIPSRNILMPLTCWHEKLQLESRLFQHECERLYASNIPRDLVDVLGDGNCLFYCLLCYLVELGKFKKDWKKKNSPAVWMRRKIHKHAKELQPEEWLKVTFQSDDGFVKSELDRIFKPNIDYLNGDLMRSSDEYHGSAIDCLVFAKLYSMVVVIYNCDSNVKQCSTVILDGQPNALDSVRHLDGIHPNTVLPGPGVLELVRYRTDVEREILSKSGRIKGMELSTAKGPGHFIFLRRPPPLNPPVMTCAVTTRRQSAAQRNEEQQKSAKTDGGEKQADSDAGIGKDKEGEGDGKDNDPGGTPPDKEGEDDPHKKSEESEDEEEKEDSEEKKKDSEA